MKKILLVLTILTSVSANALDCTSEFFKVKNLQLQKEIFPQDNTCFISIQNRNTEGLIYRSFLFTNDGGLMIFNSFGNGNESTTTGAREFIFFPRNTEHFSYNISPDENELNLKFTNGDTFTFSTEKAVPIKMNMAQIQISSEISPDNNGGVEFLNYQGLILDLGFMMGTAPSYVPNHYANFIDIKGNKCKVKVKELYRFTSDESFFRYKTDQELSEFLKTRCPNLVPLLPE